MVALTANYIGEFEKVIIADFIVLDDKVQAVTINKQGFLSVCPIDELRIESATLDDITI